MINRLTAFLMALTAIASMTSLCFAADLKIYIVALRCHYYGMLIVTLKLKIISDMSLEVLKVTIIPYHTNLIDQDNRMFWELYNSYILIVYELCTG